MAKDAHIPARSPSESAPKITYVTLTADNQELQAQFDTAITRVKAAEPRTCPLLIAGQPRATGETTESRSPADSRVVVARVASGSATDVADAVAAARAAFPAWRGRPWQERAAILERVAHKIRERRFELGAWLV